jgi:cyclase
MLKQNRFIPVLTILDGELVKTKEFKKPIYIGDPINTVKIFNGKFVDELVILDIRASLKNKGPDFALLREIANEAFIPLGYGGGIRNLSEIQKLFHIGFEKVIVNTKFMESIEFIEDAVRIYGSQSIIAAIDVKKDILGNYFSYSYSGTKKSSFHPLELALRYEQAGVGEILITSINNEGGLRGYDSKLISDISSKVKIPVIANGGADSLESLQDIIKINGASAAAASSFFIFYGKHKAVLITFPSVNQ